MARSLATAMLLTSVMAAGCLQNDGPDPGVQIFEASLAQLNEVGPSNYDMVLRRQTIGAVPDIKVVISVRNDVVTSRIYFGTTIPVSAEAAPGYPDIPGLFAIVHDAMAGDPFLLSTTYDEIYGYPSSVQLDVTAAQTSDNVTYTVEEFIADPVPLATSSGTWARSRLLAESTAGPARR